MVTQLLSLTIPRVSLLEKSRQWKYSIILTFSFILMGLHALSDQNMYYQFWFDMLVGIMMALALVFFVEEKSLALMGWITLGLTLVLEVLYLWFPTPGIYLATIIGFLGLHLLICTFMGKSLLKPTPIHLDKVLGTVTMYISIGATWSLIYFLMERLVPGSFYMDPARDIDHLLTWADLLYFSFVTMAGLGYGDITPVQPSVRSLALIESTMGLFYMAILVALMVSQFNQRSNHPTLTDD